MTLSGDVPDDADDTEDTTDWCEDAWATGGSPRGRGAMASEARDEAWTRPGAKDDDG